MKKYIYILAGSGKFSPSPRVTRTTNRTHNMTTIYLVKLIHPKHGIRKVETLATSLKEAERITAELWASTHWKVFCQA